MKNFKTRANERFYKEVEKINSIKDIKKKEILSKYAEIHVKKVEKEQIVASSALRSIDIAKDLCNFKGLLDEKPYSIEATKKWWKHQLNRKHKRKDKPISFGTLEKLQGQAGKFLKYLEFYETGEDLVFFNPGKLPPAKASRYFVLEQPRKQKEIKRFNLEKFAELLKELSKSPYYYERAAAVILILAYDTGCRYSEIATLKNSSIFFEGNTMLIQLEDSKTKTRTIIPILSKKYLINWQATSPTKDNPEGYFLPSRLGGELDYDKVSSALKKVNEKVGFEFPENKLWHYARHEFVSRMHAMPENLIRYYCGWSNGGIRATYSHNNWKDCLPFIQKANENHLLLDEPLSILEKQQEDLFEKQLEQMIEMKVKNWLVK